MFVEYNGKVYIGRLPEDKENMVEIYSPIKFTGFEKVKTVGFSFGKLFSKSRYRKIVSLDSVERVYDYRFEGKYYGEVFAMIGFGNTNDEYDYRFDTYFDEEQDKGVVKVVLFTTDVGKVKELGFMEESDGIYTKVVGSNKLDAIHIVTKDYLKHNVVSKEISLDTFKWYMRLKFRGYETAKLK